VEVKPVIQKQIPKEKEKVLWKIIIAGGMVGKS